MDKKSYIQISIFFGIVIIITFVYLNYFKSNKLMEIILKLQPIYTYDCKCVWDPLAKKSWEYTKDAQADPRV